MIDCVIATCAQLPELDPDDKLLAAALADQGAQVTAKIWNDPANDWSTSRVCVVRSTWDYHKKHVAFAQWIDTTSEITCLLNPAHVIQWNSHKFYLRDLERKGIPTVPTQWVERGAQVELENLLQRAGWLDAVIKPAYGASADGVLWVGSRHDERESGQLYLEQLLQQQDALVQPYIPTISNYHERALVFIDGDYSHAVAKLPFMHANSDLALRGLNPPGASGETAVKATEAEITAAYRALKAVPTGHVYARVDLVHYADAIRVMEVELIEPTLYLFSHPPAARRLASAILSRIDN